MGAIVSLSVATSGGAPRRVLPDDRVDIEGQRILGAASANEPSGLTTKAQVEAAIQAVLEHFRLATPQWSDLMIPDSALRNGASAPTLTVFAGAVRLNAYDEGNEAHFAVQMPHDWAVGTPIHPHVHCAFPNSNAGNFAWGLEYLMAPPGLIPAGGIFAGTTIQSDVLAAPGVTRGHHIVSLPEIDMAGQALSTMILARLFRVPNVAGGDYASSIFMCEVDFHYQRDALGSQSEYIK